MSPICGRSRAARSSRSGTRSGRAAWSGVCGDLICAGQLDVVEAQRMMAEDWVEAYGRFFPTANFFPPCAGEMTPR